MRLPNPQMLLSPCSAVVNRRVANPLGYALVGNRNRKPLRSLGGFDLVAVPPVTFGVLNIVVKNKRIHAGNEVKVTAPGYER